MNIVIIGDGKVGHTLAVQLSEEKNSVTLIERKEERLRELVNELDVSCVVGDGANAQIQRAADVPNADLVIACTSTDEMNMFCCLIARRLGAKQTIARVRNPIYYDQVHLLKEDLKLSMAVNPELALAGEISRVLIFPSAAKIETFAKGRVEMVSVAFPEHTPIEGMTLSEMYRTHKVKMLICAVQRDGQVYIPDGSFVLQPGDRMSITASHEEIEKFLRLTNAMRGRAKTVLICGGGRVAYYLGRMLLAMKMQVKIIEVDERRCVELADLLPKATIIHGSGTDHELLEEEGIGRADAFVALTGSDEENIIMSMYARTRNVPKVVSKVNDDGLQSMVDQLGMESVVSAKNVTANVITSYVRAMRNSLGSANVETVYRLLGGRIEAVEFLIREKTRYTGVPLRDLKIKSGYLVACIVRGRRICIPGGSDTLEVGDSVIVVSMRKSLEDLKDILG